MPSTTCHECGTTLPPEEPVTFFVGHYGHRNLPIATVGQVCTNCGEEYIGDGWDADVDRIYTSRLRTWLKDLFEKAVANGHNMFTFDRHLGFPPGGCRALMNKEKPTEDERRLMNVLVFAIYPFANAKADVEENIARFEYQHGFRSEELEKKLAGGLVETPDIAMWSFYLTLRERASRGW